MLGHRCSSARLCVSCPTKTTTTSGPAPRLAACVLGVARRYEFSDVARMAYGACASDGRSADAWTERAPILRGGEGVKRNGRNSKIPFATRMRVTECQFPPVICILTNGRTFPKLIFQNLKVVRPLAHEIDPKIETRNRRLRRYMKLIFSESP